MMRKFNPKNYGKTRIYIAVPNAPRISRLWVWHEVAKEYQAPTQGKCYMVGRYEMQGGSRKRKYRFFGILEEAREWQQAGEKETLPAFLEEKKQVTGPLFHDVISEWKQRCFPAIAASTHISYENLIRLHFRSLLDLSIHEITPQRVDFWLDELKSPESKTMQSRKRVTFKNELKLLSTILNYYDNYHDDPKFQFPIKQRHRLGIRLNRNKAKSKDLGEEAFLKFRDIIRTLSSNGDLMAALATVQFYQALRISEAAALYWEDIDLDWVNQSQSRIRVMKQVVWPRKKELTSYVQHGFKNAKSNAGVKEQPMFPETFDVLAKLHRSNARGLVFQIGGEHLEYRAIQSAYDRAFRKAGLPFTGTHVMRHGGCRRIYNQGGDLAVAQQLLGNSDLKSTLVYAKRNASALTEVAKQHWDKKIAGCLQSPAGETSFVN
jgi:integrase